MPGRMFEARCGCGRQFELRTGTSVDRHEQVLVSSEQLVCRPCGKLMTVLVRSPLPAWLKDWQPGSTAAASPALPEPAAGPPCEPPCEPRVHRCPTCGGELEAWEGYAGFVDDGDGRAGEPAGLWRDRRHVVAGPCPACAAPLHFRVTALWD